MARTIRVLPASEIPEEGASRFVEIAASAVAARGAFHAALAGGRTPRALYRALAEGGSPPFRELVDWSRTWLAVGDERNVAPDDPESNYAMAREALLSRVPLPPEHVVRFETERGAPEDVALHYERALRAAFGAPTDVVPRFDLVLLGMGADGHVASLFPGCDALAEEKRLAVATWVERLGAHRFTLTLPVVRAARHVMVVVVGAEKAGAVKRVLEGGEGEEDLPARLVAPVDGELLWLLDPAAASSLAGSG